MSSDGLTDPQNEQADESELDVLAFKPVLLQFADHAWSERVEERRVVEYVRADLFDAVVGVLRAQGISGAREAIAMVEDERARFREAAG